MNLQGIIIGCFYLLILLFLTWHFGGEGIFLRKYIVWDTRTDFHWAKYPKFEYMWLLVSLPFLLLTFVVYSILPELQNMHGYTLRAHVVSLIVTNVIRLCVDDFPELIFTRNGCLSIAFILSFSIFSSVFWLNVICFDTWCTLRQSRSYRTNLKKREKKMFIMYSIFAWGISFVLIIVYAILNIPSISKHLRTSPKLCVRRFWYDSSGLVYFFVPVGVSVIVNICLYIAMVLTIWNHSKQTDHQLRNSRSSHDNKNRFTVYVTLSAVLGISWILKVILWWNFDLSLNNVSNMYLVLWHIVAVIDLFQGVILFFAFVFKEKIKLLLLKRISWQDHDPDNISRNNNIPSTHSNTVTLISISTIVSMQEISLSNQQINHRVESYS